MPFFRNLFSLLFALTITISSMYSPVALAWDGAVAGKIVGVEVASGQNFGFRVSLGGVSSMCAGGPSWAYLNEADSNYKTFVAVLLLAKVQDSNLTIYTTRVGSYCQIGYITVSS